MTTKKLSTKHMIKTQGGLLRVSAAADEADPKKLKFVMIDVGMHTVMLMPEEFEAVLNDFNSVKQVFNA